MLKDAIPVLCGEICAVQLNTQGGRDGFGISEIFLSRTVLSAVVLIPIFHEQAFDVIPLIS